MMPGAVPVLRSYAGSYNSLHQLYQGTADIATSHLWDEETGTYNFPFITRLLPGMPVMVIRLLGRKMGIYTGRGNPRKINGIGSLASGTVRMINREKGSGTRILLDQKLKTLGIDRRLIPGYEREYSNHLSIAGAVARGEADFGMGAESAARQVDGVEFIPIQTEWYDLVFPRERREEPTFRLLTEYLTGPEFREEIAAAGLAQHCSQYFAALTNMRSVGVMGDGRSYDYAVALRSVQTGDFMTADWKRLPYELLDRVSVRIVNEVRGVNRVLYDITSKPPATVEYE